MPDRSPFDADGVQIRSVRALLLAAAVAACGPREPLPLPPGATLAEPRARAAIDPATRAGADACEPAIWVDPRFPSQSLILVASDASGLAVHGLDGRPLASVPDGPKPRTLHVAYGIRLGERTVDVLAGLVESPARGLHLWTIDPEARSASAAVSAPLPVLDGTAPHRSTLYRRARDGALFAFVSDRAGRVEQHAIEGADGTFTSRRVRTFEVGGTIAGLVADEERGVLFVAEEARAVWRYDAEPGAPATTRDRALVLEAGSVGVGSDLRGLALYQARGGKGYLLVAARAAQRILVLDREAPHAVRKVIVLRADDALGDVTPPDGLAVESFGLAGAFATGLLVVRGGHGAAAGPGLLYAWTDVAGIDLLADARRDPRAPHWRR